MRARRILVTGASGALGHAVTKGLREHDHDVRGYDLNPSPDRGDHHVGNLLDVDALRRATKGRDVIVHLAGVPDRDDFATRLVPNNIVGTHNVFEAARLEGVERVVYASSCRVVGGLDWDQDLIGLDAGLVPGDHYGLTKATGELMGEMYSNRFGLAVLCARLGWFVRNTDEANSVEGIKCGRRIYLSHQDAVRFFSRAVEGQVPAFAAVFVTSRNGDEPLFDPRPAQTVLGFLARDTWPEGSSWSDDLHFASPAYNPSLLPESEG
jgi:NAD+ dependent glucose-6-phosphate dehydrogenase